MRNQCHNLTEEQRKYWLKLLQKTEELLGGTPIKWKTYPVHFELK